jgi:hypothetical protein
LTYLERRGPLAAYASFSWLGESWIERLNSTHDGPFLLIDLTEREPDLSTGLRLFIGRWQIILDPASRLNGSLKRLAWYSLAAPLLVGWGLAGITFREATHALPVHRRVAQ